MYSVFITDYMSKLILNSLNCILGLKIVNNTHHKLSMPYPNFCQEMSIIMPYYFILFHFF